jgi:hypothetical protein
LAGGGTAIWLVANPAAAQENESPLRGELTEKEVLTDLVAPMAKKPSARS